MLSIQTIANFFTRIVAAYEAVRERDRAKADEWWAYAEMARRDGRADLAAFAERVSVKFALSACGYGV